MTARRTKKELEFHKALKAAVREQALSPEVFNEVQAILDNNEKRERALESSLKAEVEQRSRSYRAEAALDRFQEGHAEAIVAVELQTAALAEKEVGVQLLEARLDERLRALDYSQNFALQVVRAPVFRSQVDTMENVVVPGVTASNDPYVPGGPPFVDERPKTTTTEESQE